MDGTKVVPIIPAWVTFPEDEWMSITPAEAGLDVEKWEHFLAKRDVKGATFGGEEHTANKWGTVFTRGGYIVHTWGNRNYKFQTASLGKAFVWAIFGFAVDEALVDPDEPIHKIWTGEGQLSHRHKHLNRGHHKNLTWRHLLGSQHASEHYGGFPIERGSQWLKDGAEYSTTGPNPQIPAWANWTGDPWYDNYSHVEPGTVSHYSSGGYWRLAQALTFLWHRDLKTILDEKLFSKIGIPANRWDWPTGRTIKDNKYLYRALPDAYTYLDAPYEIDGQVVRSGPGWVVMEASDIARFGHLLATDGNWKGEQLIAPQWLRRHGGGNGSLVSGESQYYTAMGRVTTQGIDHPLPEDLFAGPVQVR